MQYEYRCRNESCPSYGIITVFAYNDMTVRCHCNSILKRKFSFQAKPQTFQPHYNNAVGQYVRNYGEFTDALHRNSDKESERTGMEHNFQPLHPTDIKPPTSEGLHEQERTRHDRRS